jgi:RNAse (barnase) inhibitor barstar
MADVVVEYIIDGKDFASLNEFYDEITAVLIPDDYWGQNLDAFNDISGGGFGTLDNGFRIRWINSDVSRRNPGHSETVRQLERGLQKCHPTNRTSVAAQLAKARNAGALAFSIG